MLNRARSVYQEYPSRFWVLVGAGFIDSIGGTMLFPFFALYITRHFNVGMTEAGVLLGVFSIAGLAGGAIGGALTDRFGRRGIVLFGLVFSALSAVAMGLVDDLAVFYPLAALVGFLGSIADPARGAMVADLLPEEKRAEGYGLMRVTRNLAWIIGPTVGGLAAQQSYLWLFIMDAITSSITAAIVYRMIPETMRAVAAGEPRESLWRTVLGYRLVARDGVYLAYIVCSMLMLLVYQQMYSTLSVYLRDVHAVPAQGYGLLLSLDAGVVVVAQFWVTRRIRPYPPMLMMALGTGFYLVGFTMYGFVSEYPLFVLAILIITAGEMIVMPVSQAVVATLAPEDMRGRYIAAFDIAWSIPSTVGPGAAGLIMDHYDPRLVWYAGGAICAVAVAGFLLLNRAASDRLAARTTDAAS